MAGLCISVHELAITLGNALSALCDGAVWVERADRRTALLAVISPDYNTSYFHTAK